MEVNLDLLRQDIRGHYESGQSQVNIARDLGVAQGTVSNIFDESGRVKGLRIQTVEKIAAKLGVQPERYLPAEYQKTPAELEVAEKFTSISAYDLATGITYIGKRRVDTLDDACIVPTRDIAEGSNKLKLSPVQNLRRHYEAMRANSALSSFEFSPLEVIATYDLGRMDNSIS